VAAGQTYNLTHARPLTQQEFMNAIAKGAGAEPARRHVEYGALYAAGYTAERIARWSRSGRRPPVTRLGVGFLRTDKRFLIDKARRELGYAVRMTAGWYGPAMASALEEVG
jgi:nucleoside-diphosphate-sugar epimerase